MSRSPNRQRRELIRDVKLDRTYARYRLQTEESEIGKATFRRALERYDKILKEHENLWNGNSRKKS